MKLIQTALLSFTLVLPLFAHAEKVTIAAAADLKFAMNEIVTSFQELHPADQIEVNYGSSGRFHTQMGF